MNKFIFNILLLLFIGPAYGQTSKIFFIGVQPSITIEPFYEKGELDVNIIPVVFEAPIGIRTNIRLLPFVNYHSGGLSNGVSDIALYSVLPIYFRKRESAESKPYGFYIGPVLGFGRNLIYNHYTTTLALEPGYMFEAKNKLTIGLGIQFGASFFAYESEPDNWLSHWGPKVSFGFWLDRSGIKTKVPIDQG